MRQSPFLKAGRLSKSTCAFVLFSSCTTSHLHATEIETSGAVTVTHLTSNEDAVASETLGIFDLDIEGQLSHGRFHFYIEGTTTSKAGKVTDVYGLSYADAGAAADDNGNGRIQLSGAEYYLPLSQGELVMGLLYPTGFTESTAWANDETTQFISSSFVNITTSGAPDYAFGLGYLSPLSEQLTLSVLVSQAQGLGDLDGQYNALFDHLDDYFFAAELAWKKERLSVHLATWLSTLDEPHLLADKEENNRGLNLSLGYDTDIGRLVLRYGTANEKVSDAASFIGLSWQSEIGDFAYGLGTSRTFVSDVLKEDADAQDVSQSEIYIKYNLIENMHGTLSLQKMDHSDFAQDKEASFDLSPTIIAARLSYEF